MRKFFASLRRLLALERAHISLGAVVQDAISKIIIPSLQKMANNERTPEERERYEALIREYAEYADPRNPKSRKWAEIADINFNENMKRTGISPALAEDAAQDVASDFYTSSGMSLFERFNPVDGPVALVKYWNMTMHNKVLSQFQKVKRELARKQEPNERDEGDVFKGIPSRREEDVDNSTLRDILDDLSLYVHSRAKSYGHQGQYVPVVFDKWLEVALEKGADSVNISRDVYEPVMKDMEKRGEVVPSRTMINEAWPAIKKMVVRFFEDELDVRISDKVKQKLRMSSEMLVATEMFRRKLAHWILGT